MDLLGPGWWVVNTADIVAAAHKATFGAGGVQHPKGVLADVLSKAVFGGNAGQTQQGVIMPTIPQSVASLTGVQQPEGMVAVVLRTARFLGLEVTPSGTITGTLPQARAAVTGIHQQLGTATAVLAHTQAVFSGAQTQAGSVAVTAQKAVAAISANYGGLITLGQPLGHSQF